MERLKLMTIALLLLGACSSRAPEESVSSSSRAAVPAAPSTITIALSLPIAPLAAEVNQSVPGSIERLSTFEMDSSGRFGVKYRIERDLIRMGMRGSHLRATTTFRYGLTGCMRTPTRLRSGSYRMWPCVSCGMDEPLREAAAVLDTRIALGNDWRIQSRTVAQPVVLRDDCRVTLLNIDISEWKVAPFINDQLESTARTIDRRISTDTTLERQAEAVWKAIGSPLEIAPRVWLSLAPEAIALGPLSGEGQTASTSLILRARPSVVIGTRPPTTLPALPRPSALPAGSGIEVAFQTILPFDEAGRLLETQFAQASRTRKEHPIEISNVVLAGGADDEVIVRANAAFDQPLAGRYEGPITLRGRPAWDPASQTIFIADLDYSLDDPGVRSRIADFVIHSQFRSRLQDAARWPAGPRIEHLRRQIDAALNRSLNANVTMSGRIDSIRVQGLDVQRGRFVIPAIAQGNLAVTVADWR